MVNQIEEKLESCGDLVAYKVREVPIADAKTDSVIPEPPM